MANKLDSSSENKYRQGWKDDTLNPASRSKHTRPSDRQDAPVEQDLDPEKLKEIEEGLRGSDFDQAERDFNQEVGGRESAGRQSSDAAPASRDELGDQEANPDQPGLYKGKKGKRGEKEDKSSLVAHGLRGRMEGFWSKHKKKIIVGGVGVSGIFGLILLILFISGSLLLPHFLMNELGYRFATAARSYRQANQQALSRKLGMDKTPDTTYARLKQRYTNMTARISDAKKMVLLEKYRPKKIVENMRATGALDFEESTKPQGLFKRTVTTAIIVNGERIPLADRKWYRPFANTQDSFRLAAEVDRALALSERGTTGLIGTGLRTSVGSRILASAGVRGLFAWANRGRDYKGTTPRQANLKLLQERYSKVKVRPGAGSLISDVNKTAQQASDDMDRIVRTGGAEAEKLARDGLQPASVTKIMEAGLRIDLLRGVVSVASTSYGLAFPACIIVDASMQRAGPLIDARAQSLQRSFMFLASGAHQQQSGQTTGEAVGSVYRMLTSTGEFSRSNIQQLSNGGNPDTSASMIPPQGSAAGDFSILNVLLPEGAAQFANATADSVCPTLTNIWFGISTGVAELVLGFFTGGTFTAVSKLGAAGVAKAFGIYLAEFGKSLFTKQFAKRFIKQAGTIAGLALLARMVTEQYAGNTTDGTTVGMHAANDADAGAVILGHEMNRKMLGGRFLTDAEAAETTAQSRTEVQRENRNLSVFDRYFALSNPQSLTARTIVNVGTSINLNLIGTFLNMLGRIFNPANIASFFTTPFAPRVLAAEGASRTNYQTVPTGFSEAELKVIETNPTYWDVIENDFVLMEKNEAGFKRIKEKYGRCFEDSMGTLLSGQFIVRNKNGTVKENEGLCSPNNLGRPIQVREVNNQFIPTFASADAELVFRWRDSMRADNSLTAGGELANPGTKTSTGGAPVSGTGDVKELARQLLARADAGNLDLTTGARRDLQYSVDGTPIGTCGVVSLHPAVLQVLLQISDPTSSKYFKMSINNFVTGHECNGGQHTKGRAVDIQSINDHAVEDWGPDPAGGYTSQNPDMARRFVEAIGSVMPQGSRMGQIQCKQVAAASIPGYIETFADTCHHIHIDMRNVQ